MIASLALVLCGYLWAGPGEFLSTEDLDAYLNKVRAARKACGPTAAWYCLRRLGHDVTLEAIREQCPPDENGVSLQLLLELLHSHGVPAQALYSGSRPVDALPVPCILVIKSSHCVVFEGVEDDGKRVRCFEPAEGRIRTVSRQTVEREWSGEVIVLQPPALSNGAFVMVAAAGMMSIVLPAAALSALWSRANRGRIGIAQKDTQLPLTEGAGS